MTTTNPYIPGIAELVYYDPFGGVGAEVAPRGTAQIKASDRHSADAAPVLAFPKTPGATTSRLS